MEVGDLEELGRALQVRAVRNLPSPHRFSQ